MKTLFEFLIVAFFSFAIGFVVGDIHTNYAIKHTDVIISIKQKYITANSMYRDIDPFTKKVQDTIRIDDIKEGFALYTVLKKSKEIEYQTSQRLSYLQESIIGTVK